MNKKYVYIIGSVIIVLVIALVAWSDISRKKNISVNSFEECVESGYPVMESYPRRCATPDGRSFTEDVGEVPVDINVSVEEK